MTPLRLLDLFSGIGGFSLGLERSGAFKTVAFCEIEPFPQKVLRKHWPDVPIYDDVRTLTAARLKADGISADAICGGFPCQDISVAGKGAGLAGERSGLWSEYARIIGELRPRYVLVENVAALLFRGLGVVLGDLAALGYDVEWHCIPAAAVGAPHNRDRLWIVAHSNPSERRAIRVPCDRLAKRENRIFVKRQEGSSGFGPSGKTLADADSGDKHRRRRPLQVGWGRFAGEITDDGVPSRIEWRSEPDVGRVAYGVPSRVDRLGGLGNAVVPQIPELIGRAIMQISLARSSATGEGEP